ncbi:MAG: hypothetical protein HOD90_03680 [Nitrospina sp.]|nr:hypothetical protein [Nitrospina sp.]
MPRVSKNHPPTRLQIQDRNVTSYCSKATLKKWLIGQIDTGGCLLDNRAIWGRKKNYGKLLAHKLKTKKSNISFLDGNNLRDVFENDTSYTPKDRLDIAMRYTR